MGAFEELRRKYPVFSYKSFDVEKYEGNIRVRYVFVQDDDIQFRPEWIFPFDYNEYLTENKAFYDTAFFNLGMAELVSYWKACASGVISVECGSLDDWQTRWWRKLYFNGLGEFFYRNGIEVSEETFVHIRSAASDLPPVRYRGSTEGFLIPVGGGKDSCVTMQLLSDMRTESRCFVVNALPAAVNTAKASGFSDDEIFICRRRLDRRIIELNEKGYLNGHTPFSAVVACSAFICAALSHRRYIVLSNESSANDSYVKGASVNHQYSKSFEFENDFRAYAGRCMPSDIEYFSLLRPLNEWNIVRRFVRYPEYFGIFRSCNLGSMENKWCCRCSKCLFVYIMLSPFLPQAELERIFGANLLADPDMVKFLDGLVCENFDKPFECIGTREEINAALSAAVKKLGRGYAVLDAYAEKYYDPDADYSCVENYYDSDNNVPDFLRSRVDEG